MVRKAKVFVGSSSEGKKVADAVERAFGEEAEVDLWDAGEVFIRNRSFLSSLLDAASLYDFAVLVFTADDVTLQREDLKIHARDNVLFEYGLFLGRMGPRRAYMLVERGLDLPSDFHGITVDMFTRDEDQEPADPFADNVSRVKDVVLDFHRSTAEFSLLPSTALAIGYFENFLVRVLGRLEEVDHVLIDGERVPFSEHSLNVMVPDKLFLLEDDNLRSLLQGLSRVTVDVPGFRDFPFYLVEGQSSKDGVLDLYDVPLTMRASSHAVSRIFKEEFVGKGRMEGLAETREVENFEKTLRLLLDERPVWKKLVSFRYLSEFL